MRISTSPLYFLAINCTATPPTHANLTVSVAETGYLDRMNFTCDEGHYFNVDTMEDFRYSECLADETWSLKDDQECARKLFFLFMTVLSSVLNNGSYQPLLPV